MKTDFINKRIQTLCCQNPKTEYSISLELGHCKGYMQSITSGRNLPSLKELLAICDYFEITPKEFFDTGNNEPALIHKLYENSCRLPQEDLQVLLSMSEHLLKV